MADVYLTQRDIDYISRVVATEVPASIARTDPEEYSRMVNAVVDTMVNRVASESYPDTITGVANQSRQFSKITGPARLDPYGSVQAAPKASQAVQSAVAGRIADLAQGADSEIDGALSYANPNFSDASNLASWINPMIEAGAVKLGIGDSVHFHGLAPGQQPVDDVNVTAEGIPSGGIPVPYGPNDDPFALSAQAQAIDGFSGLANPVSTREAVAMTNLPDVVPFGSLFAPQNEVVTAAQPAELAAPQDSMPNEWGVINGVGPVYTPTVETWSDMAAANPVQAPIDNTPSKGLFAGTPVSGFTDMAAAGPMGGDFAAPADRFSPQVAAVAPQISQADVARGFFNVTADGQMDPAFTEAMMSPQNPVVPTAVESQTFTPGMQPAARPPVEIAQADINRAFFNPTAASDFDPSFTAGLMGPNNPVVPTSVETASITPSTEQSIDIASSRFSTPAKTSRIGQDPTFETARMPGLIDPASASSSFMGVPQAPADIAGFSDAVTAQRGPPTGIYSAEAQAQQGHVYNESLKAEAARQAAIAAANPGLLAPNFDQALNPTVASMPTPSSLMANVQAPAVAQQPAAIDPMQTAAIAPNFNQALNPTMPGLMQAPVGLSDYQLAEVEQAKQIPGVFAAQPAAVADFVAPPSVEDIQVADQQSVVDQNAVVEGPATTPALEQQTQAAVTPTNTVPSTISKPATQNKGMLSGLLSPETALGGLLGGLALGPAGGLVGALAGQQIARNGGLSNVFSGGGFMAPTTQMAGGINNIASIYGGTQAPGTFAVANNGATITAQPGGYSTYTNKFGVTEAIGPDGKISGYFGSNANPSSPDTETSSGGFFGGLFG